MRNVVDAVAGRVARGVFDLPDPLARRAFGAAPENDDGAPLDPQLHVLLSLQELLDQPELHERGVDGARRYFTQVTEVFDGAATPMAEVVDRQIPGPDGTIDVRIYRPRMSEQMPGCVFYHGGGFVIGDVDSYDGVCRRLAARGACTVVSVDYRRAPEHPFPAAIDDGVAAWRWIVEHAEGLGIDSGRLAVAGDSAGGNIATVVCQRQIVDGGAMPDLQYLIYPKTDHAGPYASREAFAEGYYLTWPMVRWFTEHYLGRADVEPEADPRVSPLQFDRLGEMPPTLGITAGFDPLRDEGRAYLQALEKAGAEVTWRRFDRLVHGFVTLGGVIDAARLAMADADETFRRLLHAAG